MKELGDELRTARQAQGMSRLQLHEVTKISMHHIEAMEEGQFEVFSDEVYRRAFIRTYAAGLGIESDSFTALYEELLLQHAQEDSELEENQPMGAPARLARTFLAIFNGTMEWFGM